MRRFVLVLLVLGSVIAAGAVRATHTVSTTCFDQSVTISGTDGVDDPLDGGAQANVMAGGAGGDGIYGFGDNDRICGDDGGDFIQGGDERDRLKGNDGGGVVRGGAGGDFEVQGNSGQHLEGDAVYGENGDDTVRGGEGSDVVNGGQGDDVLWDGKGEDNVRGGDGTDVWFHCFQSGVDDTEADNIELVYTHPSYC